MNEDILESPSQIKISIVVCTFNRAELLFHALTALANQTLDGSLFEVIVVDNNSADSTELVVEQFREKFANFRCLYESRQGLSHARNCGWRAASGEYVAFLDDDAKAMPDWCERIVFSFATASPTPVAVGGPIYPWYETSPPSWFSDDFEIRTWGADVGFLPESRARFGFSGSNMTFPKLVLEKYQGFNHNFGMVGGKLGLGEEAELFSRIYEHEPYFWYDPNIKVSHWVPIRNMKISYRMTRMYKSGQTRTLIERQQTLQKNIGQEFFHLLVFVWDLLCFFVQPRKMKSSLFVDKLRRVFYQIGYLFG